MANGYLLAMTMILFTADGTDTTFIGTWKFYPKPEYCCFSTNIDHTNITGYIFLLAGAVIILCFAAYRKFAQKIKSNEKS